MSRSRRAGGLVRCRLWFGGMGLVFALMLGGYFCCALCYLWGLHGTLGGQLWGLLCAVGAVAVLVTLPLPVWLLAPWRANIRQVVRRAPIGRALWAGAALWVALLVLSARSASLQPSAQLSLALEIQSLQQLPVVGRGLLGVKSTNPLSVGSIAYCESAPSEKPFTVVVSFLGREPLGTSQTVCLQSGNWLALMRQLTAVVSLRALRHPIKIDVISGTQKLNATFEFLEPFKLRPGLDGVCSSAACLMPWQLLAADVFSTQAPLAFLRDLRWGISPSRVRAMTGGQSGRGLVGLTRIFTRSYVFSPSKPETERLVPLRRLRPQLAALTSKSLQQGVEAAQLHLLNSQLPSGAFRYSLGPFNSSVDNTTVSIPRQAAATLVLCQLGQNSKTVTRAIEASLHSMLRYRRTDGGLDVFTAVPSAARGHLGDVALPLLALAACWERGVKAPSLPVIGRLASTLLVLQRSDGSFAPGLDRNLGQASDGPPPLYAPGQAIGALLAVEKLVQQGLGPGLPSKSVLVEAIDRAMRHVVQQYWVHPLADYFYLEENWHCLAAQQALLLHRNTEYEQFCLTYVAFKSRFILKQEEGIDAQFNGGFGLGNVVPPHNTATAGLGEALAAAIAIVRAGQSAGQSVDTENVDTSEMKANLEKLLAYLLRQQWTAVSCFGCTGSQALGGFSEHPHAMKIRVDFVQHAWAAMAFGGRSIELL